MLKANIHSIIINYTCPNCHLIFQLNSIEKQSLKYKCGSCWETILIQPIIKERLNKDTVSFKVRKALKNLGWKAREVDEMLDIIDHGNKSAEELIKLALRTRIQE